MKKGILFFLAILGISCTLRAQETIVYDFEDGQMPEGFTLINMDMLIPFNETDASFIDSAWIVIESGLLESYAALSLSWYVDDAGPADDWMILPKHELGDGAMLSWVAQSTTSSGNFPDSYQVLINTGEPTFDDFAENGEVLISIEPEEYETAQNRSIDLSAYAGQSVHIAFRNITPSGDALLIDDITISNVASSTVEIDQESFQLSVAPNPVKGQLSLLNYKLENSSEVNIQLRHIDGQLIAQYPQGKKMAGAHQFEVPVAGLSAGMYILAIQSGQKMATTRLVVK
jgi:hypothetical protein